MFEIGDMVMILGYNKPVIGKIVGWHFDEGNVWTVRMPGGQHWDYYETELAAA